MTKCEFHNISKVDQFGHELLLKIENNCQKYNHHIVKTLAKYSGKSDKILEFGAGIATLAKIWSELNDTKPDCLEINPDYAEIIVNKGFKLYKNIHEVENLYELIYSSNVLEHIEDDVAILKILHQKIKTNGSLVLYLPAFEILYSNLDKQLGHFRRYSRQEIKQKLSSAGFAVNEIYYSDCLGFLSWLLVKYFKNHKSPSESSLKFYDNFVVPLSLFFDKIGFKFLFGKNIIVYCKKI